RASPGVIGQRTLPKLYAAAAVPADAAALPAPHAAARPGTSAQARTSLAEVELTGTDVHMPAADRSSTADGPKPGFAITHRPPLPSRHIPVAGTKPGMETGVQLAPSKWASSGVPPAVPATQTLRGPSTSTNE